MRTGLNPVLTTCHIFIKNCDYRPIFNQYMGQKFLVYCAKYIKFIVQNTELYYGTFLQMLPFLSNIFNLIGNFPNCRQFVDTCNKSCAYLLRCTVNNRTYRFKKCKLLLTLRITSCSLPNCESLSQVDTDTQTSICCPSRQLLLLVVD